jgi:RimJ/RimL family protein N-acetyltransferase
LAPPRLERGDNILDFVEELILAIVQSLSALSLVIGFPPVQSVEDEVNYLNGFYKERLILDDIPSGYVITLKGENRVIGSVDFNKRHAGDILKMGYVLDPDYWGKGIVPEAAQALIEIAFTLLDLYKIEFKCYDYNLKSQAVAEELEFIEEGRRRGLKDTQDKRCSELMYGLLRSEWNTGEIFGESKKI